MNTSPLVRRRSGFILILTGAAVLMAFLTVFRTSIVQASTSVWSFTESKDLALTTNPDCNGHTGNILSGQSAAHAANDSSQSVDLSLAIKSQYEDVSIIDVLIRSGIAMAAMLGGFGSVASGDLGLTATASGGIQHWEWPATDRLNDIVISNDRPDGVWVMETGPPFQTAW